MAELRIEKVPPDLHRLLKMKAAADGTSVREIIIEAAWKAVGHGKASTTASEPSPAAKVEQQEKPTVVFRPDPKSKAGRP